MRFHVFAPVAHPLAGKAQPDARRRRDPANWVLPNHTAMRSFDRYFQAAGVAPPHGVMWANSVPLVISGDPTSVACCRCSPITWSTRKCAGPHRHAGRAGALPGRTAPR